MSSMFSNRMLWACFVAWLIASVLKMFIAFLNEGYINFRRLVGTGGMPSSHSAFVSCVATVVGLETRWDSPVFLLALAFALVTMNDAQGVRRATGHQAAILNRMVDDLYHQKPIRPERVKELLGHTPIQVFIGAGIGIAVALFFYT